MVIDGIIKIGKCQTKQFEERMRFLESNGYRNITALERQFAIEVTSYSRKENLLHTIFSKSQIGDTEFFALNIEEVKELLLCFDGKIIFPKEMTDKNSAFIKTAEEASEHEEVRTDNNRFNFYNKGIKDGDIISFIYDETVKAKVISNNEVEYENESYKLSTLAGKLCGKR